MKRLHRRWHRLIWALLLPGMVLLLVLTEPVRGGLPADAVLPPALAGSPLESSH